MNITELPYDVLRTIILECPVHEQAQLMQTCNLFDMLTLELRPDAVNIEDCKKAIKLGQILSVVRYNESFRSEHGQLPCVDRQLLKSCRYGQLELVNRFFDQITSYNIWNCIFQCYRGNNKWLAEYINNKFSNRHDIIMYIEQHNLRACTYRSNALSGACRGGHLALVNFVLLSVQLAKAPINSDNMGNALRNAYRSGNINIIQRLAKYGGFHDVNFGSSIAQGIYSGGHVKLHEQLVFGLTEEERLVMDLSYMSLACRKGRLEFINQLTFFDPSSQENISSDDPYRSIRCIYGCVLAAVTGGHLNILLEFRSLILALFTKILSRGEGYVKQITEDIRNYLDISARKGHLQVVKFMVELVEQLSINLDNASTNAEVNASANTEAMIRWQLSLVNNGKKQLNINTREALVAARITAVYHGNKDIVSYLDITLED